MALPVSDQLRYWGIAAAVTAFVLWFFGDVLLPFILGGVIAYCLDPVADRLERMGCTRGVAVAIISVCGVLAFVVLALAIIPLLLQQLVQLFEIAPQLVRDLQVTINQRFPNMLNDGSVVRDTLVTIGDRIKERGADLLDAALTSASGLVNIVVLVLVTPVVAVYLLIDWDRMVAQVDGLLPRDHAPVIRALFRDIDRVLAGFVRGMGSVSLILGTYYAAALWLVGLQFGLVTGVIAGLLTFIPYVGALVGGVLSVGLAFFQFWGSGVDGSTDWVRIVIVYAIFQSGQFVEGNILTPRLVGNSVGLHPVWLLLALSVFGSLFGFVGLLVAVPLAAALGVVARFLAGTYLESRLYWGLEGLRPEAGQDDSPKGRDAP